MIRQAKNSDLKMLRTIYYESRRDNFFWENPECYTLADFDRDTQDELIYVYEKQREIKGFISMYVPDSFIHLLFVSSKDKEKGVGRALLEHALQELKLPAQLKCVSKNKQALYFYEKNGWKKIREDRQAEPYWVMAYT